MRVHGQLFDGAADWRPQCLQACALRCLDELLALVCRVLRRLAEFVQSLVAKIGLGFVALLRQSSDLRFGALQPVRRNDAIMSLFGELPLGLEPSDLPFQ